jgi:hypothetical protein
VLSGSSIAQYSSSSSIAAGASSGCPPALLEHCQSSPYSMIVGPYNQGPPPLPACRVSQVKVEASKKMTPQASRSTPPLNAPPSFSLRVLLACRASHTLQG